MSCIYFSFGSISPPYDEAQTQNTSKTITTTVMRSPVQQEVMKCLVTLEALISIK